MDKLASTGTRQFTNHVCGITQDPIENDPTDCLGLPGSD
jgi:hypothetical protein